MGMKILPKKNVTYNNPFEFEGRKESSNADVEATLNLYVEVQVVAPWLRSPSFSFLKLKHSRCSDVYKTGALLTILYRKFPSEDVVHFDPYIVSIVYKMPRTASICISNVQLTSADDQTTKLISTPGSRGTLKGVVTR